MLEDLKSDTRNHKKLKMSIADDIFKAGDYVPPHPLRI